MERRGQIIIATIVIILLFVAIDPIPSPTTNEVHTDNNASLTIQNTIVDRSSNNDEHSDAFDQLRNELNAQEGQNIVFNYTLDQPGFIGIHLINSQDEPGDLVAFKYLGNTTKHRESLTDDTLFTSNSSYIGVLYHDINDDQEFEQAVDPKIENGQGNVVQDQFSVTVIGSQQEDSILPAVLVSLGIMVILAAGAFYQYKYGEEEE